MGGIDVGMDGMRWWWRCVREVCERGVGKGNQCSLVLFCFVLELAWRGRLTGVNQSKRCNKCII